MTYISLSLYIYIYIFISLSCPPGESGGGAPVGPPLLPSLLFSSPLLSSCPCVYDIAIDGSTAYCEQCGVPTSEHACQKKTSRSPSDRSEVQDWSSPLALLPQPPFLPSSCPRVIQIV